MMPQMPARKIKRQSNRASIMRGNKNTPTSVAAASRRRTWARFGKTSTSRREISISQPGNFRRFLLRLPALDQLIQAFGNVQTRSASSKESERN